jgi:hypothetical protein
MGTRGLAGDGGREVKARCPLCVASFCCALQNGYALQSPSGGATCNAQLSEDQEVWRTVRMRCKAAARVAAGVGVVVQ